MYFSLKSIDFQDGALPKQNDLCDLILETHKLQFEKGWHFSKSSLSTYIYFCWQVLFDYSERIISRRRSQFLVVQNLVLA